VDRDDATRFLDAAVPPIPQRLLTPPYAQIRRRVRRRRLAVHASVFAVVALLVGGGGVLIGGTGRTLPVGTGSVPAAEPDSPASTSTLTSTSTLASIPDAPPSSPDPVTDSPVWRVARVDEAGTGITIYVNEADRCLTYQHPTTVVDERADAVIITATGQASSTDCSRTMATKVAITLSEPLGDRTLRDGRDGYPVLTIRDADLPGAPMPWQEVPAEYSHLDGTRWGTVYTRPGGPDIHLDASRTAFSGTIVKPAQIGAHPGDIVVSGTEYRAHWMVDTVSYELRLVPGEAAQTSMAELESVLWQLT
jgi:hypothetical protein